MEEGFEAHEISFGPQQQLFDLLVPGINAAGTDSDDMLEDPDTMVRIYYEAINIPFILSALSWEPGARDESMV